MVSDCGAAGLGDGVEVSGRREMAALGHRGRRAGGGGGAMAARPGRQDVDGQPAPCLRVRCAPRREWGTRRRDGFLQPSLGCRRRWPLGVGRTVGGAEWVLMWQRRQRRPRAPGDGLERWPAMDAACCLRARERPLPRARGRPGWPRRFWHLTLERSVCWFGGRCVYMECAPGAFCRPVYGPHRSVLTGSRGGRVSRPRSTQLARLLQHSGCWGGRPGSQLARYLLVYFG